MATPELFEMTVRHEPSGPSDTCPWLASVTLPTGYCCSWGATKESAMADLCDKIRRAKNPERTERFLVDLDGDIHLAAATTPEASPELHSVRVPEPEKAA